MPTRPKDIEWFAYIQLAVIAVGFVNSLMNWSEITATPGMTSGMQIGMMAFSYLITFTVLYFIVMRASNVARWIFVVINGFGLLMMIPLMVTDIAPIPGGKLLPSIMTIASIASFWFLFTPAARRWFSKDSDHTQTFS